MTYIKTATTAAPITTEHDINRERKKAATTEADSCQAPLKQEGTRKNCPYVPLPDF